QAREPSAIELDEFSDDFLLPQHLGYGQHEIGSGGSRLQASVHLEADDFGNEHRHGLAEHSSFGLDSTDAPAKHTESVDHGGVRVGADQRVGVRERLLSDYFGEDTFRQILEVDLVNDSRI